MRASVRIITQDRDVKINRLKVAMEVEYICNMVENEKSTAVDDFHVCSISRVFPFCCL